MGLEEAIVTLVRNEPTLTALIGTTRFYPDSIAQGAALPAVAYQRISTPREHTLTTSSNLSTARVQFTIWATSAASRGAVASAFRAFFRRINGEFKSGVRSRYINDIRIGGVQIDNEINQREPESNAYQCLIDVLVAHNEG